MNELSQWERITKEADHELNQLREKYDISVRHITQEKNKELSEACHLLNILSLNMMDDGPSWPRVLEWLRRNEQNKPNNNLDQ